MDAAIHFAAHKVGLGALKPKQVEVIKAFASGSDVLYPYPRVREVLLLCSAPACV